MSYFDNIFPELPKYRGTWTAVYLEPIIGSGEKITVAVAVIGSDGKFEVVQAIRSEVLTCLYGAKSDNVKSIIDWLIESLREHVKKNLTFDNWETPFDGIHLGSRFPGADNNIDGLIEQAIRFSSSLGQVNSENIKPDVQTEIIQWTASIKKAVKEINPKLDDSFNKKLAIGKSGSLISFGFYYNNYISNFGTLHVNKISESCNILKGKILDLETLKNTTSTFLKPEKYELIVKDPLKEDISLTKNQWEKIQDNITLLNEIAEEKQVSIYREKTPINAAKHILEMIA